MILNLRQLEVFRAIMVAKTVSGAAELLHVSQPGISRLLKYMELKLGIALFERHKGRLIPTPEGIELFRELEPIYQRIESLDITIKRIVNAEDPSFQIACTPSLVNTLVPRSLANVRKQMPTSTVMLETLSNEEIADYITQRRIDFALGFDIPDHPLIAAEPAIELGMECVVHESHPLAARSNVTFADLCDVEMISFYPETRIGAIITDAFARLGSSPATSVMVRYADDACAMVEQGLGVSIVFEHTASPHRYPTLHRIPLQGEKHQVYLFRHSGVSMSHNVRKFYDLFRSELIQASAHPQDFGSA